MTMLDQNDRIALALSGGGSRAIAFHLGCLRALNDRGVLPSINTISGVSGGAVIGALYAYSNDSFEEFDARICGLGFRRTWLRRRSHLSEWAPFSPIWQSDPPPSSQHC